MLERKGKRELERESKLIFILGQHFFVLCQQLCIKRIIGHLPSLYEPVVSLSLLLTLSRLEDHTVSLPKQDIVSSLLFEEDQTNSFTEPVQLLEYIAEALKEVVNKLGHTHSLIREVLASEVCTGL